VEALVVCLVAEADADVVVVVSQTVSDVTAGTILLSLRELSEAAVCEAVVTCELSEFFEFSQAVRQTSAARAVKISIFPVFFIGCASFAFVSNKGHSPIIKGNS
jgi:hypothetical protein